MNFFRIFHIDCGRKYFSVNQLIHIIEVLGKNHFDYIELAIGNGGMRFLLNDMSVHTDTNSYSSTQVKTAINTGNKKFCNCGSSNEYSESDIVDIISAAKDNNVKIIPLLNSPGHMDAMITAMEELGIPNVRYMNSSTTWDFSNAKAYDFVNSFLKKYISWFSAMGCEYFNMGCDEYANDVLTSGFSSLCNESSYQYDKFVDYANHIAELIINNSMMPIMFNDGMYYSENIRAGFLNPNIICSYWTSGWEGYDPAPAHFIARKGHKIITTADKWYYVLGRRENQNPTIQFTNASSWLGIEAFSEHEILGENNVSPIGAMLCLWCDEPDIEYSKEEETIVDELISHFAIHNNR